VDLGAEMIDLHCHILPDLDDGVRTMDDALDLARVAEEEGVKKIVATPHLFRDNFDWGDFSVIEEKRRALAEAISGQNIRVDILPGAEVHVSHDLINTVRKNREHLVLNKSSYMFIEFPSSHIFAGAKQLFFELMAEGIRPIITHPERNAVFVQSPVTLFELVQMGSLAQANAGSFLGLYGDQAERAVSHFLELNLVHFIATDGHSPRSLSSRLREAVGKAEALIGPERAQALVNENPYAVISDQEIPSYFPPVNPREKEKPYSIKIPSLFRRKKPGSAESHKRT
jgi:protein-tyrosine phosphatase